MSIGKRLARVMFEKGLTKNDVADEAGISRQHLGRLINDDHNVSVDALRRICKALGVSMAYALEEIDDPSPEALKAVKDYTQEVQRIKTVKTEFTLDKKMAELMTREEIEAAKNKVERQLIKIELEEAREDLNKRLSELESTGG